MIFYRRSQHEQWNQFERELSSTMVLTSIKLELSIRAPPHIPRLVDDVHCCGRFIFLMLLPRDGSFWAAR